MHAKGVGRSGIVRAVEKDERRLGSRRKGTKLELIRPVAHLPRRDDGTSRDDILCLIAMNQMTELDGLLSRGPEMRGLVEALASSRLNCTERRVTQIE